ncbi:MAG: YihY/virulence factor BrkB family protein [Halobacteriota archaeon]
MLDPQVAIDRVRVLKATATKAEISLLAAGISFYALLSIVPLAVVVVGLAAAVAGGDIVDPLMGTFGHLVSDDAASFVRTGLEAEAGRSGATITGLAFVLWGSLKVFRGLDRAFDTIYGQPGGASIVTSIRNGFAVFFAILGVFTALGGALAALYTLGLQFTGILIPLVVTPVLALSLLPMYAVFPPRRQRIRDIVPGAALAAVAITAATAGLQLYVTVAAPFAVYGVLAGIFISMTWLYVIALSLLLGAVANASRMGRDRQLHGSSPFHPPS